MNEPCFKQADWPRIPIVSACGSTSACARRIVLPTHSRTQQNTRALPSALGARPFRSAPIMATPAASLACGCFQIPRSTPTPRRRGTPSVTTPTPRTTRIRIWSNPIASACPAASATSARARSTRRLIPNNPRWANLSSTVGAQYLWVDRIFAWRRSDRDFITQLFQSWRPGTLDTSFVSTDNINNPAHDERHLFRTAAPERRAAVRAAKHSPAESSDNRQFNDYVHAGPLTAFFQAPDTVLTPHVLKGRRRLGRRLGCAQSRLHQHRHGQRRMAAALQSGRRRQTDLSDRDRRRARKLELFAATENQTFDEALFLIHASAAVRTICADAPGGAKYLTANQAALTRGKIVFAENCARLPLQQAAGIRRPASIPTGASARSIWIASIATSTWTQTADFKSKMRAIVFAPDFLEGQLSVDRHARARDAPAHQRLQPAGDQRDRQQHLG